METEEIMAGTKKTKKEQAPKDMETKPVQEENPPQEENLREEDLKIGYVVGITPDGKFIFRVMGKEKGLLELLGIHEYASRNVQRLVDNKQMSGDALVHEVGKAVSLLNQKLDQLANTLLKPENSL
jgi:hypothetical protein